MKDRTRADPGRAGAIRTFLIADIRGYTRFTDEHGDEAASRLASAFAEIVAEAMEAWGGQLVELRGDEALCTFDSPRSSLRCALELQQTFAAEAAMAHELPLNVGIGLDLGEAVPVGDGFRGAALNIAARLCSGAAAGEIRATENLAHVAGPMPGVQYEPQGTERLKGIAADVAVVRVRTSAPAEAGADARASSSPPPPIGRSPEPVPGELESVVPLIGRAGDLLWLRWYWRRARLGQGGVVEVIGPEGMGKTRLVAELARYAHADGATVRYGPSLTIPDEAAARVRPAVLVVDGADRLPSRLTDAIDAAAAELEGLPVLVIVTRSGEASDDPARRPTRRLQPLTELDVAAIAALYATGSLEPPVRSMLETSGGVPREVHRLASQWARTAAAERVTESARRTSRDRRGLRAAEEELMGGYAVLELARERTRLYGTGDEGRADVENRRIGSGVCPYKGLAAYEAADADYFFGREQLVGELVARVVGSSFVGLVGASGSGKPSALHAGLLPALADGILPGSDQWIHVPMRPGSRPMRQLADALRRRLPHLEGADASVVLERALADLAPAQRLLLVIDQFEEVFTADGGERDKFIELIAEGRPAMKVVLAVRADQYERCAAYPSLARQLTASQVLVGPLRTEEVAAIVRHPAERVGLRVEPELVDALIADLGTEPGAMPLLSTALLELWEAREDGRLTLAAHRATGGVRGAVARLAESAYARLDPEEQAAARSLFMRLIGEGSEPESIVRRRLSASELETMNDPRVGAVVEKLTAGRLLTRDEGTVEVAHEALIREWPRLREWIEADAAGRQVRLHLIGAARTWDAGGREDGDLYRGARLAATLDWATEHGTELNAVERDFLEASRETAERAAERQRRTNRILRGLLAGAGVLLVAALAAGGIAWVQAGQNAENASIAQVGELSLTAQALIEDDPQLALLLAAEAVRISQESGRPPPPAALKALWSAYVAGKETTIIPDVGSRAVAYSPDGSELAVDASGRGDALVTFRDPSTGEERAVIPASGEDGEVQSLAYSPDGRWLAVATSGPAAAGQGAVTVFDAATHEQVQRYAAGHDGYDHLTIVDAGLLAATGRHAGRAEVQTMVWDIVSGQERATIEEFGFASTDNILHSTRARSALLRPGARQLVMGLLDVVSFHQPGLVGLTLPGDVLRCPPCSDVGPAWHELLDLTPDVMAASPDGNRIAVADPERGLITVIDLVLGVQAFEPVRYDGPSTIAWNDEATMLAVAGGESGIAVLDAATGAVRLRMPSRGEPITAVDFRPGGNELAAVSTAGDLRLHRTQPTGGDIAIVDRPLVDLGVTAEHVAVSLGGRTTSEILEGNTANTVGAGVVIFERGAGAELHDRAAVVSTGVHGQVAKETGELPVIYENGSSALVDAASFRENARLPGCLGATGVSPDGAYVVLTGQVPLGASCGQAEVTSGVYERAGSTPVIDYGLEHPRHGAVSHEAGADGRRFAAVASFRDAADSGTLDLWELPSGRLIASIDEEARRGLLPASLSFSPDARYLAVGTNGPRVLVFDVMAMAEGASAREATVLDHEAHASSVRKAIVTDRGLLATSGGDGTYRFWDLASGVMTMEIEVTGLLGAGMFDFSPDFNSMYYEDGGGVIRHMPVDVDDMIRLATSAAGRTLPDDECRTYLHTDGCAR